MIGMALLIVLLLVGAIAVGGTLLAVNSGGNQRVAAPTPPQVPEKTPPTVPEKAPTTPEKTQPVPTPTEEKTVTVKIMTEPEEAELFLDGDRIPNPFDGELPVSTEPRSLEARHEGYTTYIQDLTLRYAQRVRIRLERGTGTDDRRASRSGRTKTKRTSVETPTKTAGAPETPSPEKTPATEPTPAKTPAKQPSGTGLKSITLDPSSKQPSRRELKGIQL
jgi:hypothetical protein